MFVELSGLFLLGVRGVYVFESVEIVEEWWGYDQEGYDNFEYVQEEDFDD